jgi:uncharacterized membrane protein HdeD (DUF308 family)
MAVPGLAGICFSFLMLYNPTLGVVSLVALAALALIAIGIFYIFLGLHLRQLIGKRSTN